MPWAADSFDKLPIAGYGNERLNAATHQFFRTVLVGSSSHSTTHAVVGPADTTAPGVCDRVRERPEVDPEKASVARSGSHIIRGGRHMSSRSTRPGTRPRRAVHRIAAILVVSLLCGLTTVGMVVSAPKVSAQAINGCTIVETPSPATYTTCPGANLSSANLPDALLNSANLSGANLDGASLHGANLSSAHLQGASLRHANLSRAILSGASLVRADLRAADLGFAILRVARLSHANLDGARLPNAHLTGANLQSAQLIGADLSGADLLDADLINAKLTHVHLQGTNLTGARLKGAMVEAGSLRDALLCATTMPDGSINSSGCARSLSAATASSLEEHPLVAVNTIDLDAQGHPGIVVGDQRYADPDNGRGLQVLVLDRNTLAMRFNFPVANTPDAAVNLRGDLIRLNDSSLVMVTLPSGAGPVPSVDTLNPALGLIGGVIPARWTLATPSCWAGRAIDCYSNLNAADPTAWNRQKNPVGSFSVIGVPGMKPGNAWFDSAAQQGTREGALRGYLTPGTAVHSTANANAYNFIFAADQYVPVDSCVSGGPDACVIGVGDQRFPPSAPNGLNVVILDRVTLKRITARTVTTATELRSTLATMPQDGSTGHFNPPIVNDRVVAVIQRVGTGRITKDSQFNNVLQQIDELGGTPETFTPAVTVTPARPYALVGAATDMPWHGEGFESSPLIGDGQTGRIRCVFARDRMARYTPSSGDPTGVANLELFPIVQQDGTPWLYAGNPAIPYIANAIGLSGYPDLRSAYTNLNINWNAPGKNPVTVPYPNSAPSGFPDQTEYAQIQKQLQNEFNWVVAVRTFISNLKEPFVSSQLANRVIVDKIAKEIAASVKPPPAAETTLPWLRLFDIALTVAAPFSPAANAVLGLITAAGKVADLTMFDPSGSPGGSGSPADMVHARADQLSSALAEQLHAHLASLGRIEAILLTDAGKLQITGERVENDPRWAWRTDTSSNAATRLHASTTAQVYGALLRPAWTLWQLAPTNGNPSSDVKTYGCGWAQLQLTKYTRGINYPFAGALADNQFPAQGWSPTPETWTFAQIDPKSDYRNSTNEPQRATKLPSTVLTDKIFSTATGGGAAYRPAWYRATYNPPGVVHCTRNNDPPTNPPDNAVRRPPPIPPAEASQTMG